MYLHFHSKEALAWSVAADGYDRLIEAMREADHADAGTAADRLRAQAHAFWLFAQSNRGVFRLMFGHDIGHLDPNTSEHPGSRLWRQWLAAVRACEAEGHAWPVSTERTAEELWSAVLGRFALWSTTFGQTESHSPREFTDYLPDRLLAQ
ncbi:TetR/AcrR family transcriptional regulator [Saccharopolyspora sp. NFXS83]|uniref:TetR/AcrR family transcriptional regulator n=1 Tax=Saccharopolyspora sp. NFXS83 TaxID=2993560 RepID=UPI00224A4C8B|nr:TetR/AcrR family transcriptional regulator [Saccharopolyspora sp. NFXS83]MCX2730888.1 TetR/AcrR family transcriptional regulator [Saccharopolyspora sp. NFXS83]